MSTLTQFKNGFFDRQAVLAMVEKKKRSALSKAGAYVRTTAKGSLRYRNKVSKPGQPPSVHRGSTIKGRSVSLLKELILFAYDRQRESVVVGPAITRARQGVLVPQIIEKGGDIQITQVFHHGVWKPANVVGSIKARILPQRKVGAKIEARPFMVPALAKNTAKFAPLFKGA